MTACERCGVRAVSTCTRCKCIVSPGLLSPLVRSMLAYSHVREWLSCPRCWPTSVRVTWSHHLAPHAVVLTAWNLEDVGAAPKLDRLPHPDFGGGREC